MGASRHFSRSRFWRWRLSGRATPAAWERMRRFPFPARRSRRPSSVKRSRSWADSTPTDPLPLASTPTRRRATAGAASPTCRCAFIIRPRSARKGRLYVLGGYAEGGTPLRTAFVFQSGKWRALPRLPFARAAAGAALVRGRIVVAGGVAQTSGARLARTALSFDLAKRRWSVVPGPIPREHLGVTLLRRDGVRGRGTHFRSRHEPHPLRVVSSRGKALAEARACSGLTRRDGSGGRRRHDRLSRGRGARRDDSRGLRLLRGRCDAGVDSTIFPRPGTGSALRRSAGASSRSAAGPSPDSRSAARTSRSSCASRGATVLPRLR